MSISHPDIFGGIYVPTITCFEGEKGERGLDKNAQKRVIEYVINSQKVDGIVACATTGESTLLSEEEYKKTAELSLKIAKKIRHDIIVLLGTSSTNPQITLERNKFAHEMGFDGVLLTYPPYLKPDQRGIKNFFLEVAEKHPELAIVIYNIRYRTGGEGVSENTLVSLANTTNIVGVKDAGVTIEHTDNVIQRTQGKNFSYLTGEDLMLFDVLAHGGAGAIAATAHVVGKAMKQILEAMQAEKINDALSIHRKIKNIIKLLFSEANPTPIKAALNEIGLAVGNPRGPALLPALKTTQLAIRTELQKLGCLKF